jgi:hypothetical protein
MWAEKNLSRCHFYCKSHASCHGLQLGLSVRSQRHHLFSVCEVFSERWMLGVLDYSVPCIVGVFSGVDGAHVTEPD